jgi:hypothetical protein
MFLPQSSNFLWVSCAPAVAVSLWTTSRHRPNSVGRHERRKSFYRIFGKPFLRQDKHETRAVAPTERKAPSHSFSALLSEQVPMPLF